MFNPYRLARFYFLQLKRLRGDSESLARGVALGTFIGITPTIPFHTIAILVFSFPFRASKISALLAGLMASNPLTFFPQYYFSWWIGNRLLPGILTWERINSVMVTINDGAGFMTVVTELGKLGFGAISVMLLGGFLLAIPFTLASYLVSLKFFRVVEEKRARRIGRQDTDGQQ